MRILILPTHQTNGVHEWTPFHDVLLNEILRHEGLLPNRCCSKCARTLDRPVRCTECFHVSYMCVGCICDSHRVNPLHFVEVCMSYSTFCCHLVLTGVCRSGMDRSGSVNRSSISTRPLSFPWGMAAMIAERLCPVYTTFPLFRRRVSDNSGSGIAAAVQLVRMLSRTCSYCVQSYSPRHGNRRRPWCLSHASNYSTC